MTIAFEEWMPSILTLAKEVGRAILKIYEKKTFEIRSKLDQSPVTEADLLSHQILSQELQALTPQVPILSEEGEPIPYEERRRWVRYWLIDPLDGTKEFIKKTNEFTINLALIENHQPAISVVLAPALNQCYWAIKDQSAYYQAGDSPPQLLQVSTTVQFPIRIAISRSHPPLGSSWEALLKKLKNHQLISCGSTLKICLVAAGIADIYPRFGETYEWDTAAGQGILEAAGGKVIDLKGNPLQYNLRDSLINKGFYAINSDAILPYLVDNLNLK